MKRRIAITEVALAEEIVRTAKEDPFGLCQIWDKHKYDHLYEYLKARGESTFSLEEIPRLTKQYKSLLSVVDRDFTAAEREELLTRARREILEAALTVQRQVRKVSDGLKAEHARALVPGEKTPAGAGAADIPDNATLSARGLATAFGVDLERLRKRLERLRARDHTCYIESTDRAAGEGQFLYYVGKVRHIAEALKAKTSARTSG